MNASSFIARRYFFGEWGDFSRLLTAVAVVGIALASASLVIVMSLMMGFSADLEQRLVGFNAHIVVNPEPFDIAQGELRRGASPAEFANILAAVGNDVQTSLVTIDGEAIVEVKGSGQDVAQGAKVKGIAAADLGSLKNIDWYIKDDQAAILGSELAFQLGVHPDYDDSITLINPIGHVGPAGEILPDKMTFKVGGMFKSGYFENDSKLVIIPKKAAAALFAGRSHERLHIWLKDLHRAVPVAAEIRRQFGDVKVQTWGEANKKLFAALKLERMAMSFLLLLNIAIASISVISVIFMYVFARRKSIAILASVGASKGTVRQIFIKIGAYVGLVGTILGLIIGLTVCLYIDRAGIRLPTAYYLDHLPVMISWPFLVIVLACGILLSVLSSVYPSGQAAATKINDVLRYE